MGILYTNHPSVMFGPHAHREDIIRMSQFFESVCPVIYYGLAVLEKIVVAFSG